MLKIGLTGGIGSGKTYIAKMFETLDIPVYYADKEAKQIMWKNKDVKQKIKSIFGSNAYYKNGRLHRAYLSKQIFNDQSLLKKINGIVHPAVRSDLDHWFNQQVSPYAIQEAALIYEGGNHQYFDKIITVAADDELRIKRVMKRDKISKDAVLKRINSQLPQAQKIKLADYVIFNNESESLIHQVWKIHTELS